MVDSVIVRCEGGDHVRVAAFPPCCGGKLTAVLTVGNRHDWGDVMALLTPEDAGRLIGVLRNFVKRNKGA